MALVLLLQSVVFLLVLLGVRQVASAPEAQQRQLLITSPPGPRETDNAHKNVLRRQQSCDFGECGGECLSQGAFCCGPAGTVATSPKWVCDNGACITSVRGTAGIVDCYDPDNPGGTTQSCIDNMPTTTCKPTDKCYTCNTYQPYCHWQTYIASNSPTLSWFSCVESKVPDATFLAATITDVRPRETGTLSTQPSAAPTSTAKGTRPSDAPLSTTAIIGIAVGAGVAVISIGGLLVWYYTIRNTKMHPGVSALSGTSGSTAVAVEEQGPLELDSQERSELNSTTAYGYGSQPGMPYSVAGAYGRDVSDVDKWGYAQGTMPPEAHFRQPGYSVDTREVPGEMGERGAPWRAFGGDLGR